MSRDFFPHIDKTVFGCYSPNQAAKKREVAKKRAEVRK
jgi:hypothetical protein